MTPGELLELRIADVITHREYDVLLLRARGLSQQTIAIALDLSRARVRAIERTGQLRIDQYRKDAA